MTGIQTIKTDMVGCLLEVATGTSAIPLVCKEDRRLLEKLIDWAHMTTISLGRGVGHRPLISTVVEMRRNQLATYTPNLHTLVSAITLVRCRSCILERGFTGQSPVPTYTRLGGVTSKLMRDISTDLVGPIKIYSTRETRGRGTLKGYILVCACINTGMMAMKILTGKATGDVILGLMMMQQRFTAIESILMDA